MMPIGQSVICFAISQLPSMYSCYFSWEGTESHRQTEINGPNPSSKYCMRERRESRPKITHDGSLCLSLSLPARACNQFRDKIEWKKMRRKVNKKRPFDDCPPPKDMLHLRVRLANDRLRFFCYALRTFFYFPYNGNAYSDGNSFRVPSLKTTDGMGHLDMFVAYRCLFLCGRNMKTPGGESAFWIGDFGAEWSTDLWDISMADRDAQAGWRSEVEIRARGGMQSRNDKYVTV